MLKKLNKNHPRIFRSLLSLLVVFCLIFNLATTPVYALEVAAAQWIGVAATSVIASALILLGIQRDSAQPAVFDSLVDSVFGRLQDRGEIYGDGLIDVLACQKVDGEMLYAAKQDLVAMVLDSVLDLGAISVGSHNGRLYSAGDGFDFADKFNGVFPVDGRLFLYYEGMFSAVYLFVSEAEFQCLTLTDYAYPANGSFDIAARSVESDGVTYWYASYPGLPNDDVKAYGFTQLYYQSHVPLLMRGEMLPTQEIGLQQGLKEGDMAIIFDVETLQKLIDEKKIQGGNYDNGEDQPPIPYVPLALGSTYEETATKTQQDVWEGLSDYTTSVLDNWVSLKQSLQSFKFTFGSIKTILQNVLDLLGSLATAITSPITSLLSPMLEVLTSIRDSVDSSGSGSVSTPPGVNSYAFDLTSFFPFCIPFDIYNMLNAFRAEPVTPRWELNLDFGALGSYPVVVDLAPWDQLAAVCRTFQVVLFCVGLAAGTKKLLGW